jgi:urease gamma subunit
MQELREQVRDRSGVLDLIQENAAKAVMMVELVTSFVANQKMSGVPLDEIPALRILPSFMNSAQRALKDLISLMPSNEGAIDVDKVLEAVRHGQEES